MSQTVDLSSKLSILNASLDGELYDDNMMRTLYATDASVYREIPTAVAMPKHAEDIIQLVMFARQEKLSLIPRAAGTSLAGQCVGNGIVVDVSRHLNQILEVNQEEGWVRVQPGVVRDELNHHLKPYGLFFGPNTSTANRAMIGGMVGNNSCGSYSIVYGTTRDHVLEAHCVLSDGSEVVFKSETAESFEQKRKENSLEGNLYNYVYQTLSKEEVALEIRSQFPKQGIHRRNTGYALDVLLDSEIFQEEGEAFNFCKLLSGSEGTLAFLTEIKIHVDPLPPAHKALLCAHYDSLEDSLKAVLQAMPLKPRAVELMDKIVMDCTKGNRLYRNNRAFIKGDPEAILMIEMGGESMEEVYQQLGQLVETMKEAGHGYHFPIIEGEEMKKAWDLRKAGLGLLSNMKGDAKPVAVIEDTAVDLQDLPSYIGEFADMMKGYGQRAVYYAHAGAGELHLRPILNLKSSKDVKLFRDIATSTAELVKKYDGSLSGEHGDGRVRAEFIPHMVGPKNYELFQELKRVWDPQNIFNPGKIVDAAPMDEFLRFEKEQETPQFDTIFDFSETDGILRAVEQCNGSGDCRKSHLSGGTMCPSYMATRNEKDTTRARANILREFLTRSNEENPFAHKEIYEVLDLCLSCKGCTSECPSNVDMATLKAEFLHQYYKKHGVPLRAKAIANIGQLNKLGALVPGISNFFLSNKLTSGLLKSVLGVAPLRSLPTLQKTSFRKWFSKHAPKLTSANPKGQVYVFCDEFTDFNDTHLGITLVNLLTHLGYEVLMPPHAESGRAYLSKGLLREARTRAMYNVESFKEIVSEETPLVGIEPSAILSFRDEYPKLVIPELREEAKALGKHALLFEEFLAREIDKGNLDPSSFTTSPLHIHLHGHCHQKSLAGTSDTHKVLSLPENYTVSEIPSGCCGMAGSFGYEKEHYELSMKVGEMVLFPAVRNRSHGSVVCAPGTSCRHQIKDGTDHTAYHPVELLWEATQTT
ncbi:MAG: FAD-linked oxidase C-terminal domain-containing protein [Bacteroidota bacterium]